MIYELKYLTCGRVYNVEYDYRLQGRNTSIAFESLVKIIGAPLSAIG